MSLSLTDEALCYAMLKEQAGILSQAKEIFKAIAEELQIDVSTIFAQTDNVADSRSLAFLSALAPLNRTPLKEPTVDIYTGPHSEDVATPKPSRPVEQRQAAGSHPRTAILHQTATRTPVTKASLDIAAAVSASQVIKPTPKSQYGHARSASMAAGSPLSGTKLGAKPSVTTPKQHITPNSRRTSSGRMIIVKDLDMEEAVRMTALVPPVHVASPLGTRSAVTAVKSPTTTTTTTTTTTAATTTTFRTNMSPSHGMAISPSISGTTTPSWVSRSPLQTRLTPANPPPVEGTNGYIFEGNSATESNFDATGVATSPTLVSDDVESTGTPSVLSAAAASARSAGVPAARRVVNATGRGPLSSTVNISGLVRNKLFPTKHVESTSPKAAEKDAGPTGGHSRVFSSTSVQSERSTSSAFAASRMGAARRVAPKPGESTRSTKATPSAASVGPTNSATAPRPGSSLLKARASPDAKPRPTAAAPKAADVTKRASASAIRVKL